MSRPQPPAPAPVTSTTQSHTWMGRLRQVQNDPAALVRFARQLDRNQRAKAREQWRTYRLWRHQETGEFLGVISPTGAYRRVQQAYHLPYWTCSSEFASTISATNSALSRAARQHPEWGEVIAGAYVNPKHAYAAFLLIQAEKEQTNA